MQSDYLAFVAAAYGATALVLLALIAWVVLDARAQRRALAGLEAQGLRRRSAVAAQPAEERAVSGAETRAAAPPRRRRSRLALLPFVLFAGLAGAFLYQLLSGHDPQAIPSVLVGRSAPQTVLPPLEGLTDAAGRPMPGIDLTGFGDGRPVLVNVFASWCGPCRDEHPFLMDLARNDRLRIVAINYKDEAEDARGFLARFGNPFDAVGVDPKGAATIDWGVYGVPESFLVSGSGEIVYKQTGPFTEQSVRTGLLPALDALAPAGIPAADTSPPVPDRAG